MSILDDFIARAKQRRRTVVLPEGGDARVVAAARRMADEEIADPILIGTEAALVTAADEAGVSLDGIRCLDAKSNDFLERYTEAYLRRRDVKPGIAARMVKKPLFFGGMMVAEGDADTMVAGVAHATATVIQAGVLTIGMQEGIATPSSFFLMVLPEFGGEPNKTFVFADCAVTIDPTAAELADIALASHASAAKLLGQTPRVAMLSFSTRGSAAHAHVDKVTEALALARQRGPELLIDGEFQFDTAVVPRVAAKKVKGESDVAGQANVLIFPDLDSGNIGYKLTQYLAGAQAIGPFLQGFAKPISDLSRGASSDDIVATSAVVSVMT